MTQWGVFHVAFVECLYSIVINVSIISSDKAMCDLHKFRLQLALDCKKMILAVIVMISKT